jgi:hypothetical protein
VPKYRGDGKGGLISNDVTCSGIEHTLGYRGSPITQLYMEKMMIAVDGLLEKKTWDYLYVPHDE